LQGIIGLNKAITMNKEAKEQYMKTLQERYLQGSKKEKGMLLNEYCQNTGMDRKYVIQGIQCQNTGIQCQVPFFGRP
jgi:hypothetical protein